MAAVKKQLDLDNLDDDGGADPPKSLCALSVAENVEEEKCVVGQYRTTTQQKNIFLSHLTFSHKNSVPIEWVIDIADESNGWFYGTAYHYDDSTRMLHVMVPDKHNPSFDGKVLLDHRTVHLIECVDGKTDALFNKIVRDSVVKVKWDVEWFEENEDDADNGTWIMSSARYFIGIANQLLVEDKAAEGQARGFVILSADLNLKLLKCHKDRGVEDFARLVNEGVVQASDEAVEFARKVALAAQTPKKSKPQNDFPDDNDDDNNNNDNYNNKQQQQKKVDKEKRVPDTPGTEGSNAVSIRKLTDMSRGLKDCVSDIIYDHNKTKTHNIDIANMFMSFALDGDLDQGLNLIEHFEHLKKVGRDLSEEEEQLEHTLDEARYLSKKLESGLVKALRDSNDFNANADEEIENLRISLKKLKRELDDKDREIAAIKGGKSK